MASVNMILMVCSVLVLSSTCCLGLKVDLVHRDSPLSPFHEPTNNKTQFEQVMDAARRSISRANNMLRAEVSTLPAEGEYVMTFSLGTPPVKVHAVVDTASDLIWTPCKPCDNCSNQVEPVFDSDESSTYRNLACYSTACTSFGRTGCDIRQQCTYAVVYEDKSYTVGSLATDTIQVGPSHLLKARFGCSHTSGGSLNHGVVGLGGGPFSLVRQLGDLAGGKFSYCLASPTAQSSSTSSLFFGRDAVVSGNGVVSTPLVKKDNGTFYYLTLGGISVGANRVAYNASKTTTDYVVEGNMVIDSGTSLTVLPTELFSEFVSEVKSAIDAEPKEDPSGVFGLCYDVSGDSRDISLPTITVHFQGGDVVLESTNSFVLVEEGLLCMTLVDRASDVGIFGNLAQRDYLIAYDLNEETVSFKPTDCIFPA